MILKVLFSEVASAFESKPNLYTRQSLDQQTVKLIQIDELYDPLVKSNYCSSNFQISITQLYKKLQVQSLSMIILVLHNLLESMNRYFDINLTPWNVTHGVNFS